MPADKKISRIFHNPLVEVTEWLKKGPLTAALLPHVKSMKDVIYKLRARGWPITTTFHEYYDNYGVQHSRAEYRLSGNWTNRPLPFGGITNAQKSIRKASRPAQEAAPGLGVDLPAPGRPGNGGPQEIVLEEGKAEQTIETTRNEAGS